MIMMMVVVAATSVSTRLGVERRLDLVDVAAQAFYHLLDHVIRANANALAQQLHRQMPIAEMPGDADHLALIVAMDFQQRLRLGANPHHATVVQCQPIAVPQPHRLWQVEQYLPALLRWQQNAPAMTAIKIN